MIKSLLKKSAKRKINRLTFPNSKRNRIEKRLKNIALRSLRIAARKAHK